MIHLVEDFSDYVLSLWLTLLLNAIYKTISTILTTFQGKNKLNSVSTLGGTDFLHTY